jgi:hypothetical protein
MSKNIILLSDGTGQSGGVGYETNVWRLYQALKVDDDSQLISYDDGVGSQRTLISKLMGNSSAVGLDRNVRELYTFLVRHWEKGDRIYMFGFSRGAFTVRLLADLIASCGLLDLQRIPSEKELNRLVKSAYSCSLKGYYYPAIPRTFKGKFSRYKQDGEVDIHFMGVWDTVGAIGLPFKEVRYAMHNWMRYGFRGLALNKNVKRACQAMSIDDCRESFHPIVWNERTEEQPGRIHQVWFAGVHSNVGGGYPKKQLALVALDWMIQQVKEWDIKCSVTPTNQLQFYPQELDKILREKKCDGRLYNSRSGPASIYRYLPRNMELIRESYTEDDIHVHPCVFSRIENSIDFYSPHNLTERCDSPRLKDEHGQSLITDTWRESMKIAWSYNFLQRLNYYFLVSLFVVLLISFYGVFAWGSYLPLILGGLTFTTFGFFQWWLRNRQTMLASIGWHSIFNQGRVKDSLLLKKARDSLLIKSAKLIKKSGIVDFLGGFKNLVIYVLVYFPGFLYRFLIHDLIVFKRLQGIKIKASDINCLLELKPGQPQKVFFETNMFKKNTGLRLHKGRQYRIQVEHYSGWYDKKFPASPTGFSKEDNLPGYMKLARKAVRLRGKKMFALLAESGSGNVFKVGMGTEFTCLKDGELAFYVNDINFFKGLGCKWPRFFEDLFYQNNRGSARISVEQI